MSLEIIAELARRSRDRTLLLTGDYRTEDVPRGTSLRQWRARLVTQRIAEEVRLVPLDAAETALVTTLILDTGLPAPRDVAAAVYERTDGIPLHIEELLGALSAEARADGTAIREAGVPETIEDAIIARIATLSPEAQATARAGAVIGRCFVPDVLAGIMDVPPSAIEAPLQELVDQFVLDAPGSARAVRLPPSAPARRAVPDDPAAPSVAATTPGPASSGRGSKGRRRSTRRSTTNGPACGARRSTPPWPAPARPPACRRAARRSSSTGGPSTTCPTTSTSSSARAILDAYAVQALSIEEHEVAEPMAREAALAFRAAGQPARAIKSLGERDQRVAPGRPAPLRAPGARPASSWPSSTALPEDRRRSSRRVP